MTQCEKLSEYLEYTEEKVKGHPYYLVYLVQELRRDF